MKAAFWDARSRQYDEDIRQHDLLFTKTIKRSLSLLCAADTVLDLGCATGETSLDVAAHVQWVHGIDLSTQMIDLALHKARRRQVRNISFEQAEVFDRSLARIPFTAVLAFNIFHLVDDPPGVLNQFSCLLAPDGLLISQTPCLAERGSLFGALIGLAHRLNQAPPVHHFQFTQLERLFEDSNFEILESSLWDIDNAVQWIVAQNRRYE